ncbi:unnamed protein product [Anisakis simplex]|uniref:Tudor domain-containing protein n=1 Tax=Anisakis simplex TaxID=6269 RepID=A0A0M3JPT2_ANISI|nr:unnamed protein product [Anisakis simplex]
MIKYVLSGFPSKPLSSSSVEYYNDEAIYRHLKDDADAQEPIVVENAYSLGAVQEEEKTSGRIYDTIVCQRSSSQREIKFAEYDVSQHASLNLILAFIHQFLLL